MIGRVIVGFGAIATFALGCSSSSNIQEKTKFTKLDSLTDTYLVYQDSLLQSWNRMVKTENEKARSLQEIVSELSPRMASSDLIESLQVRVEQLERIRFTQKSLGNVHVVDEYDHAIQSIVKDLQDLRQTAAFVDLQQLLDKVEWIEQVQAQTGLQRYHYDSIASSFNQFLNANKSYLKEIERNVHLENKPLFKPDSSR